MRRRARAMRQTVAVGRIAPSQPTPWDQCRRRFFTAMEAADRAGLECPDIKPAHEPHAHTGFLDRHQPPASGRFALHRAGRAVPGGVGGGDLAAHGPAFAAVGGHHCRHGVAEFSDLVADAAAVAATTKQIGIRDR